MLRGDLVCGAISIVLEKGVPTFRASSAVVKRIDDLLQKEENSAEQLPARY